MSTSVYDSGEGYVPGDPLEVDEVDLNFLKKQMDKIAEIENPILRMEKAKKLVASLEEN